MKTIINSAKATWRITRKIVNLRNAKIVLLVYTFVSVVYMTIALASFDYARLLPKSAEAVVYEKNITAIESAEDVKATQEELYQQIYQQVLKSPDVRRKVGLYEAKIATQNTLHIMKTQFEAVETKEYENLAELEEKTNNESTEIIRAEQRSGAWRE